MLAKAVKVTPGPDQTQLLQCSKVNLNLLLVQLQRMIESDMDFSITPPYVVVNYVA